MKLTTFIHKVRPIIPTVSRADSTESFINSIISEFAPSPSRRTIGSKILWIHKKLQKQTDYPEILSFVNTYFQKVSPVMDLNTFDKHYPLDHAISYCSNFGRIPNLWNGPKTAETCYYTNYNHPLTQFPLFKKNIIFNHGLRLHNSQYINTLINHKVKINSEKIQNLYSYEEGNADYLYILDKLEIKEIRTLLSSLLFEHFNNFTNLLNTIKDNTPITKTQALLFYQVILLLLYYNIFTTFLLLFSTLETAIERPLEIISSFSLQHRLNNQLEFNDLNTHHNPDLIIINTATFTSIFNTPINSSIFNFISLSNSYPLLSHHYDICYLFLTNLHTWFHAFTKNSSHKMISSVAYKNRPSLWNDLPNLTISNQQFKFSVFPQGEPINYKLEYAKKLTLTKRNIEIPE